MKECPACFQELPDGDAMLTCPWCSHVLRSDDTAQRTSAQSPSAKRHHGSRNRLHALLRRMWKRVSPDRVEP